MSGGDCKTECAPSVFEDPEAVAMLKGSVADLQRAAELLDRSGIDSQLVKTDDDSGAGGCCKTTIYLVVAREDAAAAQSVFDSEWKRGLTEDQIAALEAAASIDADPDSGEMTCPACLTTFASGPTECPDCGLSVG